MTNLYGIQYNPYKKEINNLIYKSMKEMKKKELIKTPKIRIIVQKEKPK